MPYGSSGSGVSDFAHRRLARAVHRDRTGEHEAAHLRLHRLVQHVHRADDVVGVVEAADEVAQPLGGVGGEVEDVRDAVLGEEPREQRGIEHRSLRRRCVPFGTLSVNPPLRSSRPTTSWPRRSSCSAT